MEVSMRALALTAGLVTVVSGGASVFAGLGLRLGV
jgi:hypothetical protein